jgi:hypothetical protein
MTITKVSIQESDMAIIVCCGEAQPSDTKIVINDLIVPIQAIYTAENGFNPQPGDPDQFSIGWSWLGVENWTLGDSFSLVNSVETYTVTGYLSA